MPFLFLGGSENAIFWGLLMHYILIYYYTLFGLGSLKRVQYPKCVYDSYCLFNLILKCVCKLAEASLWIIIGLLSQGTILKDSGNLGQQIYILLFVSIHHERKELHCKRSKNVRIKVYIFRSAFFILNNEIVQVELNTMYIIDYVVLSWLSCLLYYEVN